MGDTEMDTTQEQVDPEPLAQRLPKKKRRIEGATGDSEGAQEMTDMNTQKPSNGNHREGVKNLRSNEGSDEPSQILHHNPQEGNGPTVPQEDTLEQLKVQHSRQLEVQEQKYREDMNSLKRELEEKNKSDMEALRSQMEELRKQMVNNQPRQADGL